MIYPVVILYGSNDKSYRYCRILIAILFFSFALRSLPYFQAQKKPAICRRLPRPRYIWAFQLCTPFNILYQSQSSLLDDDNRPIKLHRMEGKGTQ